MPTPASGQRRPIAANLIRVECVSPKRAAIVFAGLVGPRCAGPHREHRPAARRIAEWRFGRIDDGAVFGRQRSQDRLWRCQAAPRRRSGLTTAAISPSPQAVPPMTSSSASGCCGKSGTMLSSGASRMAHDQAAATSVTDFTVAVAAGGIGAPVRFRKLGTVDRPARGGVRSAGPSFVCVARRSNGRDLPTFLRRPSWRSACGVRPWR